MQDGSAWKYVPNPNYLFKNKDISMNQLPTKLRKVDAQESLSLAELLGSRYDAKHYVFGDTTFPPHLLFQQEYPQLEVYMNKAQMILLD